jgi:glycosyltransferase involved in cell wall biosynthesis
VGSPELVSALVPAYNHERYVRECLTALAAQTHRPLELIIGDDASTDGTADEIRSFLRDHGGAFERVVFEEGDVNGGTAAMLNRLLAHARGRYLFLNASDDRAAPHAIATLAAVLDGDPRVGLAVGDSIIIDSAGRRVYWGPDREVLDEEEAAYRTWVEFLRATNRPGVFDPGLFGKAGTLHRVNYIPNGKLFRRSAVDEVGGWRPQTVEDWDLNFRLACRYRLRYVDEVLFAYRWHESNTIKSERFALLWAATEALIARDLRRPSVWLQVMAHRDIRGGLSVRLRRLHAGE